MENNMPDYDDLSYNPTSEELEVLAKACMKMMMYIAYQYRIIEVAIPRWLVEIAFPADDIGTNHTIH